MKASGHGSPQSLKRISCRAVRLTTQGLSTLVVGEPAMQALLSARFLAYARNVTETNVAKPERG